MTEKKIIENPADISKEARPYDKGDLIRDAEYYMAVCLTNGMLDEGLITEDEYRKIIAEHAVNFAPTLAPLMR